MKVQKCVMFCILAIMLIGAVTEKDTPKTTEPVKKDTVSMVQISREIEGKVKTVYDISGRPVNQSQNAKGYHRVFGGCKLVAGVDTVTLNSSTAEGKQDITFISSGTYSGMAWSLSASNGNTYRIVPIGFNQFVVMSSDTTDTSTINFQVEGE